MNLNNKKTIRLANVIAVLIAIAALPGIAPANGDDGYQKVAVAVGEITRREWVLENISRSLNYAKVNAVFLNEMELRGLTSDRLKEYDILLLVFDDLAGIPASPIREYAGSGGSVVFLKNSSMDRDFMDLAGIKEYGKERYHPGGFGVGSGFLINNRVLSGRRIGVAVREAKLEGSAVFAKLRDKKAAPLYPVAWTRKHGEGTVLFWNTDALVNLKTHRGLIVQSLHHVRRRFVTALANVGMMMVDDFPAPWRNINYRRYRTAGYKKALEKTQDPAELRRLRTYIFNLAKYDDITDTEFVKNIWAGDIDALGRRFGFSYTGFLLFNDGDTDREGDDEEYAIQDFYQTAGKLPVIMGEQALKKGWELGFHGYNRLPLADTREDDSPFWGSRGDMARALEVSKKEWEKLFGAGNLPLSYSAPDNYIDSSGLSVLGETFPSIKVVCARYHPGEDASEHEFGWNSGKKFFQIPRITWGYFLNDTMRWALYDAMHGMGIVSHVIRPDEVFSAGPSAGYAGWQSMKKSFSGEFEKFRADFPWVRWLTVKEAFAELRFYNDVTLKSKTAGKSLTVYNSGGSDDHVYFRVRVNPGERIARLEGCRLVNIHRESGDIIFKTNRSESKITFR